MRGEIIFVTAKRRWPPLKLDNDRSEESTTFWTRISRVTMSLYIYVFSNIVSQRYRNSDRRVIHSKRPNKRYTNNVH